MTEDVRAELARRLGDLWATQGHNFYGSGGSGGRAGIGERPCLVIIDMLNAFNDASYKLGGDQDSAVESIASLVEVCRKASVPVVFVTTIYDHFGAEAGFFGDKIPALAELARGSKAVEIDERLGYVADQDVVVEKKFASAFFGTSLSSVLRRWAIDTVVLTGCSTSGCIRAASIDAVAHGFRVVVPLECVSDRAEGPHLANLFDIDTKYGDVIRTQEVSQMLSSVTAHN